MINQLRRKTTVRSPFEMITKESKYTKKEANELRKKALYMKRFKN